MLAMARPLAVVKFPGTKGAGQGIIVSLGVFSVFQGSDSIIFCIADIWLSSLVGGNGQDLVINRFADVRTVLGHGVGPLDGMDITGSMAGVAVPVVLVIRVAGCCSIGEILWTGIGLLSLPWSFGHGLGIGQYEFLHWVHCRLTVVPWWFFLVGHVTEVIIGLLLED